MYTLETRYILGTEPARPFFILGTHVKLLKTYRPLKGILKTFENTVLRRNYVSKKFHTFLAMKHSVQQIKFIQFSSRGRRRRRPLRLVISCLRTIFLHSKNIHVYKIGSQDRSGMPPLGGHRACAPVKNICYQCLLWRLHSTLFGFLFLFMFLHIGCSMWVRRGNLFYISLEPNFLFLRLYNTSESVVEWFFMFLSINRCQRKS